MPIGIVLHNNDRFAFSNDLFVTVQDLNLAGGPPILQNQRINMDQAFSLAVQEDGNGNGNIAWDAHNLDGSRQNHATVSVTDGQTVELETL